MSITRELIIVANPGSQSRKYALYAGDECKATIHFEFDSDAIVYTLSMPGQEPQTGKAGLVHLTFAATKVLDILREHGALLQDEVVSRIGLRIVAPSSYFQKHHHMTPVAIQHLRDLLPRAIIHISAALQELELLAIGFPDVPIIGVSDSAFDSTEPSFVHSYAIPQKVARELDIWRFGYHGLSVNSVTDKLKNAKQLPRRIIVCHLGGGASVSALKDGVLLDSTMGYSPLEGLMMPTRSGSIDPTAVEAMRVGLGFTHDKMQEYLNLNCGLLGVSGISGDIRELLACEDSRAAAKLALQMYVTSVQKAIGQMSAVLGGIDMVAFTGTVGERSAIMRGRIISKIEYLGLTIDPALNKKAIQLDELTKISTQQSKYPVLVVPCDEASQIAKITRTFDKP
ncbi:MAG: hypothetical protein WCO19_03225 [Candidatus Saccharibacteria bacterium]